MFLIHDPITKYFPTSEISKKKVYEKLMERAYGISKKKAYNILAFIQFKKALKYYGDGLWHIKGESQEHSGFYGIQTHNLKKGFPAYDILIKKRKP